MEDLVALLLTHGSLLVFVVTLAARAGAPVPAAPLLVVAGGLSANGQIALGTTILASLLANLLGDLLWFVAGRRFGYRALALLCRISLSPDTCVRQSEDMFGRWAGLSLVAAKFVPGVSLLAAPMAGALRMRWASFLMWTLLAASVWTLAFMGLGALFRTEINRLLAVLVDSGVKAFIILVALVACFAAYRWMRRRQGVRPNAEMLVSASTVADELAQGAQLLLLDLRGRVAREATRQLPGSIPAELARVGLAVQGVAKDARIVAFCNCPNEISALMAASTLQALGFRNVRALAGGFDALSAIIPDSFDLRPIAESP